MRYHVIATIALALVVTGCQPHPPHRYITQDRGQAQWQQSAYQHMQRPYYADRAYEGHPGWDYESLHARMRRGEMGMSPDVYFSPPPRWR